MTYNSGGPRPPRVMAITLRYKEAQEHLLRRLGQAVVLHWDELPDELQDLLIDQAAVVSDRNEEAAHAAGDIESFIRNVKSTALPKETPQGK